MGECPHTQIPNFPHFRLRPTSHAKWRRLGTERFLAAGPGGGGAQRQGFGAQRGPGGFGGGARAGGWGGFGVPGGGVLGGAENVGLKGRKEDRFLARIFFGWRLLRGKGSGFLVKSDTCLMFDRAIQRVKEAHALSLTHGWANLLPLVVQSSITCPSP